MRQFLCFALLLIAAPFADAEIFQLAVPAAQGMKLYWWPVLPPIAGWEHDEGASRAQGVNALVPAGQTFAHAPAIIYARALYKPRMSDVKSLDQLIEGDISSFKKRLPDTSVEKLMPIRDGDGKDHPYYSFTPSQKGSWELVAYGEEGDYYLIFTVSGNSKQARDDARAPFEALISKYQAHPASPMSDAKQSK
jgi:hypothetical protein